jgi:hypothetical protein
MVHGALNMKRYASPKTGDWPMNMAEEHKIRLARTPKGFPFLLGVPKADGVHVRQAKVQRRVVLKQEKRRVAGGVR